MTGLSTPPALANYTLYEFNGQGIFDDCAIKTLTDALNSSSVAFAEDCSRVGPLTDPILIQDVRRQLYSDFNTHLNPLRTLPVGSTALSKILVVVADTEPDAPPPPPSTVFCDHGPIMRGIIKGIICPTSLSCAADVVPKLALPLQTNDIINTDIGGKFGTPIQLADSIYRAVGELRKRIQASNLQPPPVPRLVINLSVGSQPDVACTNPLLLESRPVYDALTHAACYGALVVAAAGNNPGGTFMAGRTCPAAWTTRDLPDATTCATYLDSTLPPPEAEYPVRGQSQEVSGAAPPDLLVYAAMGVDYTDRLLANKRPGSESRFAGLGIWGTSPLTGSSFPTPLTGSSLGAAVTSAVAAAVWSYRPKLTPAEVMQIVYDSGTAVPTASSLVETHRVSLCKAINRVCGHSSSSSEPPLPLFQTPRPAACPTAQTCDSSSAVAATNPPSLTSLQALLTALFPGPAPSAITPFPASTPFPFEPSIPQDRLTPPWSVVDPQPRSNGCSLCLVSEGRVSEGSRTLISVTANRDIWGLITGVSVAIYDTSGGTIPVIYGLPTSTAVRRLNDGQTVTWPLNPYPDWARTAVLTWTLEDAAGPSSLTEQILILPRPPAPGPPP